ncbi:TPA: hypothetical protein VKX02_001437 [Streptococcus pyogenes]|nr:hypothetical protein [Streptococcus pyogenes]HER5376006.1 hypothetical protein [Streptococcus pyogenes]
MIGQGGNKNYHYMFSMSLIFMFFYAVLILSNSEGIYELAENMENMKVFFSVIFVVSFLVTIKFAIDGITQVIIGEREKLGIYSLAGNRITFLARMVNVNLLESFFIASIIGVILGTIYSHCIVILLELIFEISNIEIDIIGFKTFTEYILLLFMILCTNYLVACIILKRKDVKDLIYYENILKVEDSILRDNNLFRYSVITAGILALTVSFIFLIIKNIQYDITIYYIMASLISCSFLIYRLTKIIILIRLNKNVKFSSKSFFKYVFSQEVIRNWKKYYRNQCLSTTILCLSCLFLFSSLTIGYSYKENIAKEAPFDLAVSVDAKSVDFSNVKDKIDHNNVNYKIEYKVYSNEDLKKYNLPTQCIKLSDYNYLRKMLNKEPINLSDYQYLVQVEDMVIEKRIKDEVQNTQISINNKDFYMAESIQNFPFLQSNINGKFELLIFNDEVINDMRLPVKRNVMMVSFKNQPKAQLKNELYKTLNSSNNLVMDNEKEHITIKVVLKEWSRLNGLVGLSILTIFGIFLSSILILIAINNIAFYSIKNLDKIYIENKIYFDLGWSLEQISQYNAFRNKAFFINATEMILLSLVTGTVSMYYFTNQYLDNDMYIFAFATISLLLYLLIMFVYNISLNRILCNKIYE